MHRRVRLLARAFKNSCNTFHTEISHPVFFMSMSDTRVFSRCSWKFCLVLRLLFFFGFCFLELHVANSTDTWQAKQANLSSFRNSNKNCSDSRAALAHETRIHRQGFWKLCLVLLFCLHTYIFCLGFFICFF